MTPANAAGTTETGTTATSTTDTGRSVIVTLSAAGVTVVLETGGNRLPAIVHWGRTLEGLTAAEAADLVAAAVPVPGPNEVDVPVRLSLLPEHAAGWPGRPGLHGSRRGAAWSPSFEVTSVVLDGVPVQGFVTVGAGKLEVQAVDDECGLGLVLQVELTPQGLLRARAEVTNLGIEPYTLDGLVLAYPVPGEASELLDFAGRWARERSPQRGPFPAGIHLRENRRGRTGADSAYVLHAGTPGFGFAGGQVHAVHTAYSGNHVHYAERVFTGRQVLGGGELLLPGEVQLAQGEQYLSPWVYGSFGTGLDQVAHRFHAHLRSRPRPVGPDRPVSLNVWEAVYFDHDLSRLTELADRAAEVGVERFVLDDGWFGARRHDHAGLGDWVVSTDAWPDGLHPLVDHVRGLGMEFGLWFEPEMVNPDSDVARAHPEWIMAARRRWPVESRSQQVLNLGIPAAYEHVKGQLLAILDTYAISYVKWDHNRDLVEAGNRLNGGRPGVRAQTLAYYRLLDEIRAAHPTLEIESCSSGGARVDLEVLERTDRVWASDCIDPLERQHIGRWTSQLIPPELLGAHIGSGRSHTTGRVHDLGFRAATAVFGHLGIEWDLTRASGAELAVLGEWVAFYKANRELLLTGELVRMDSAEENRFVHGVVAPDRSRAIFALVTVGSVAASPGDRVRFRGLDPRCRYRLRPLVIGPAPSGLRAPPWWGPAGAGHPGAVFSGAALEHVGVAAPILDPEQAVLFLADRREH